MLCYRCGSHVPDGTEACGTCGQKFALGLKPGPIAGFGTGTRRHRIAVESAPYKVGDVIAARFEVRENVGAGPVGWVFKCIDRDIDVDVALKVVSPRLLQTGEERRVLSRELRTVRRLSHPNIVRVYEDGEDGDRLFFTMQYLEGLTLRRIWDLRRQKGQVFALREVEPIVQQIAQALDAAHELSSHGDLKPDNVIILPDLVKITDFGLANAVPRAPFMAAQKAGGVHRYLAPEFLQGDRIAPRADVFSLGVIVGEMLTGAPFEGQSFELLARNPALPSAVDEVFRRAVSLDAAERYAHAGEFAAALAEAAGLAAPRSVQASVAPADASPAPKATGSGPSGTLLVDAGRADPDENRAEKHVSMPPASRPTASKLPSGVGSSTSQRLFTQEIGDEDFEELEETVPARPLAKAAPEVAASGAGPRDQSPAKPAPSASASPAPAVPAPSQTVPPAKAPAPSAGVAKLDKAAPVKADSKGPPAKVDSKGPPTPGDARGAPNKGAAPVEASRSRIEKGPRPEAAPVPAKPAAAPGGVGAADAVTKGGKSAGNESLKRDVVASKPDPARTPVAAANPPPTTSKSQRLPLLLAGGLLLAIAAFLLLQPPAAPTHPHPPGREPSGAIAQAPVVPEPLVTADAGGVSVAAAPGTPAPAPARVPVKEDRAAPDRGELQRKQPDPSSEDKQRKERFEAALLEQERLSAESRAAEEKAAADKVAADKVAAEKVAAERLAAERAAAEKLAAEKLAAERLAAERAAAEKATADRPANAGVAASTTGKSCPAGMRFIPAAKFKLGAPNSDPLKDLDDLDEVVEVDAYCVDIYEAPNRNGVKPSTGLSWKQAFDSCRAQKKRLCSEEEWEHACKGPGNARFPYGKEFDANACNSADGDGNARALAFSGVFSACGSGYGVFDLSGNAAEWTSSSYDDGGSEKVVKGGAADRPDSAVRCASRARRSQGAKEKFLGFRCCVEPR